MLAGQPNISFECVVHLWLAGRCRPKPQRLGYIAAILKFSEEDILLLAALAGYDADPDQEALVRKAYREWHALRERWQDEILELVAHNVRVNIANMFIDLLDTDSDFRQTVYDKHPTLFEMVKQTNAGAH